MAEETPLIEIQFDEIIARTPDAILFKIDRIQSWIPKSQIHDYAGFELDDDDRGKPHEQAADPDGRIIIPVWLAVEKGIEAYGEEL